MNAEVFISYASKDRKRILDLVDRLESAGVSVWIDQMSIEGATMWSQEIVSAIRNCKVLILAISGNSADSKNVVKELALASEGHKNILPVYLESAEIPGSMAYQLAGIQRVEFFEGDEEVGQQSVIRALAKLGVTVSEEASTAAAGAPNRTSHGASLLPQRKLRRTKRRHGVRLPLLWEAWRYWRPEYFPSAAVAARRPSKSKPWPFLKR